MRIKFPRKITMYECQRCKYNFDTPWNASKGYKMKRCTACGSSNIKLKTKLI